MGGVSCAKKDELSTWLEFIAVLGGSSFGAYLAARVELASIKE
jgi:hypothetical protein